MGVSKIPDAPTLQRPETDRSTPVHSVATNTVTDSGVDFVPRTLKNTAVVVAVGAFLLASTNRFDLLLPFVGGALLGAILLAGMEWMIRKAFSPDMVLAIRGVQVRGDVPISSPEKKKFGGKTAIVLFGLIKYPAVALLIWWIARNATRMQIAAFISGFILLHIIIGLRGLGAFLFPKQKK